MRRATRRWFDLRLFHFQSVTLRRLNYYWAIIITIIIVDVVDLSLNCRMYPDLQDSCLFIPRSPRSASTMYRTFHCRAALRPHSQNSLIPVSLIPLRNRFRTMRSLYAEVGSRSSVRENVVSHSKVMFFLDFEKT